MNLVRPLTLPNGVKTRTVAYPVAISGYEFDVRRPPPALGAHTDEVTAEWLKPTKIKPRARRGRKAR